MERRTFLKLGSLSTLSAAAPTLAEARNLDVEESDVVDAMERIDAGIASIRARYGAKFESVRPDLLAAMRQMSAGVYAYQALHDQPIDVQIHPLGQARIVRAITDVDRGSAALHIALQNVPEAEFESLEELWQHHHRHGIEIAAEAYGHHGGSARGKRRFHRLAEHVRRDVHRTGLRNTLRGYLEEMQALREHERVKPRTDPQLRARAERAAERWRAKGVSLESYDVGPATEMGTGGRVALGILGAILAIGGVILIVVGIAGMAECWCVAIFALLGGIALVVLGALLLVKASTGMDAPHGALEGG